MLDTLLILILITGRDHSITEINFQSMNACETAKEQILETFDEYREGVGNGVNFNRLMYAHCVYE